MNDLTEIKTRNLGVRRLARPVNSGTIISFFEKDQPIGSAIVDNPDLADLLGALLESIKANEQEKVFLAQKLREAHQSLKARPQQDTEANRVLQDRYDQLLIERDQLRSQLSEAEQDAQMLREGREVEAEHFEIMKDFVESAKSAQAFKKYSLRRTVTLIESMKSEIGEMDVMSGWDVIKFLDRCSRQVQAEAAAGRF